MRLLVEVKDYHEIDSFCDAIKNEKAKAIEIGALDKDGEDIAFNYLGIIYTGKKPTEKEVEQLLKDSNYVFNKVEIY